MLKYEEQARNALKEMRTSHENNKDEVRKLLAKRKAENLIERRAKIKKHEYRIISLIRRVDYRHIRPTLRVCSKEDRQFWRSCRELISSAPYHSRVGRQIMIWCIDENTGGLLGVAELNSDLNMLPLRDHFIGWSKDQKFKKGGLNHIGAIGTCVCVDPFGALTGGKFMINAVRCAEIADCWESRYGDAIAIMTTTSLFGKSSIYNRLKEWQYLGCTKGQGVLSLSKQNKETLNKFLRANNLMGRVGGVSGNPGGQLDVVIKACQMLKIPFSEVSSNAPKGVYLSERGSSAVSFLNGASKFCAEVPAMPEIRDWWLARWYAMRLPKVSDRIDDFDPRSYSVDSQIETSRRKYAMAGPPAQRG